MLQVNHTCFYTFSNIADFYALSQQCNTREKTLYFSGKKQASNDISKEAF